MAKVYRAKDHNGKSVGPWCGRYMDALKKRRHVTLYASKLESQRALDELVSNGRVQSRRVEEKVIPVSELEVTKHAKKPIGPIIETFITGMAASATTKKQMAYKMGQVVRACNLKTVADFAHSAPRFQRYLRTLPGTKSHVTIEQLLSIYSRFGRWLRKVDRGYIMANPGDYVEMPDCDTAKVCIQHRGLQVLELEALCSSLDGDRDALGRPLSPKVIRDRRDRAISYRLRAMTGVRETEACRLRVGDINWKESTLTIPRLASKTHMFEAVLPLPESVLAKLRDRYKGMKPKTLLWPNGPFHRGCLPRDLRRAGIAHVDEAGEVMNDRSFRMSFTSWCVEAELSLLQITMLRRDVGKGSRKLIVKNYSSRVSRLRAMRAARDKLDAWITAQLSERLSLVG